MDCHTAYNGFWMHCGAHKITMFMERHSGLCLTTKTCALLLQNPHTYEVIEVAVFLSSIPHSGVRESVQCDTPH